MEPARLTDHGLMQDHWLGVVINANDPLFTGRAKIKVFGISDFIRDEHIPWATPINSSVFGGDGAGSISVPKVGTFVRVQFNNGDVYAPEYTAIQNVGPELVQRIQDDYPGTHVLLHDPDEELTVIFQRGSGLQLFYRDAFFQITPDSMITVQTPNADSVLQLEGDVTRLVTKNEVEVVASAKCTVSADEVIVNGSQTTKVGGPPYYNAVLAEPLWALMGTLATALDAKLPPTPGLNAGLVEAAKQAATSTNVLIGQ